MPADSAWHAIGAFRGNPSKADRIGAAGKDRLRIAAAMDVFLVRTSSTAWAIVYILYM